MKYRIFIQPTALKMLKEISGHHIRGKVAERIDSLAQEPEKQGKPLLKELAGYRSLRAAGQRYRIIYSVNRTDYSISVVAVGIRKEGNKNDIYNLARKLVRLGLA